MKRFKTSSLFTVLSFCTALFAADGPSPRWAITVKYVGLTYHPFGVAPFEFETSLDKGGFFSLLKGLEWELDYALNRKILLRVSTSIYKDCADLWAGYYHFGFRANFRASPNLIYRVGIGPTVIWRENWWEKVAQYGGNIFYGGEKVTGKYETAFLWYGGNMELDWKTSEQFSLVYAMIPGFPSAVTNSVGVRRRF